MLLNICFASMFLLFFMQFQKQQDTTIYMHQVGIFKENDNALLLRQTLNEQGIPTYSYQNDDLIIVVCNLSQSSEELKSKEALLADKNISFIEKEVSSSSASFRKAVEENDIDKVMELMKN